MQQREMKAIYIGKAIEASREDDAGLFILQSIINKPTITIIALAQTSFFEGEMQQNDSKAVDLPFHCSNR